MKKLIYIIFVFSIGVIAGFIFVGLSMNWSMEGAILTQPVEIFNADGQKVAIIYQGAYLSRDKITSDFRFKFSPKDVGYQRHDKIEIYYRGSRVGVQENPDRKMR